MKTESRTPTEAIAALKAADWPETKIAEAVGVHQSFINRLANGVRSEPAYSVGKALVDLALRELGPKKSAA